MIKTARPPARRASDLSNVGRGAVVPATEKNDTMTKSEQVEMGLIKMDWLEGVRRCREPRAIVLVRRLRRRRRQGNICVTLDISRQCDKINQWTTLLTYHYFDTEIKCSFFVFSLSSTTDVSKLVSHVASRHRGVGTFQGTPKNENCDFNHEIGVCSKGRLLSSK